VPARWAKRRLSLGHCGSGRAATTGAFIGPERLRSRNFPLAGHRVRV